jgi:porphobilinogen deaminase
LLAVRPDLTIVDIRGNVDTRLGRVKGLGRYAKNGGKEDLDAVVLAASGLARLGHSGAVTETIVRSGLTANNCAARRGEPVPTLASCGR